MMIIVTLSSILSFMIVHVVAVDKFWSESKWKLIISTHSWALLLVLLALLKLLNSFLFSIRAYLTVTQRVITITFSSCCTRLCLRAENLWNFSSCKRFSLFSQLVVIFLLVCFFTSRVEAQSRSVGSLTAALAERGLILCAKIMSETSEDIMWAAFEALIFVIAFWGIKLQWL